MHYLYFDGTSYFIEDVDFLKNHPDDYTELIEESENLEYLSEKADRLNEEL